jgi:hypothetical protein
MAGTERLSNAEGRRLFEMMGKGGKSKAASSLFEKSKHDIVLNEDRVLPAPKVSAKPAAGPKKNPKKGKFGNVKVADPKGGKAYDSKLEARHGAEYEAMLAAGQIKALDRQREYVLHAGIKYRADFLITHLDGSLEVVDSKGVETEVFKIKRKLFLVDYPHIKFTTRKAKARARKVSKRGKK